MQDLAQQPGQQRDKGHADQGNAAARNQLLDALALAAGVILSITLQQVDAAPDTQGTAQTCLLYTSPSPRDVEESRMPSSA